MSERQRCIAPRRSRQRGDDVTDLHAAARLAGRQQHESHQQECLAEHRECHVDATGARRRRAAVMRDQPEGRDADESIDKIERQQVGGDEDADDCRSASAASRPKSARRRAYPATRRRRRRRRRSTAAQRLRAALRPAHRGKELTRSAGCSNANGAPPIASSATTRAGSGASHRSASAWRRSFSRQAGRQHDERRCQRRGEQCWANAAHWRPPIVTERPICSTSKNAGGAKPSNIATSASARAAASRLRCTGAFKNTPPSASAGASTR